MANQWYKTVDSCCRHWQRVDGRTLALFFREWEDMSAAYKTLRTYGGQVQSLSFEKLCGLWLMICREPKV